MVSLRRPANFSARPVRTVFRDPIEYFFSRDKRLGSDPEAVFVRRQSHAVSPAIRANFDARELLPEATVRGSTSASGLAIVASRGLWKMVCRSA